jgi:hypothetical protein
MPDDTKEMHTPGPWHVVPRPWDEKGCTVNTTKDPHVGKLICDTSLSDFLERDEHSLETMRANAKLIAAAPELLNACEKITEAISPYTRTPGATPDPAMYASRAAFHAIAKARVLPPKFAKLPDQDERDPDNERSTVSLTSAGKEVAELRDENERLKERIADLEKACEKADVKLKSLHNPFARTPDPKSVARDARDILCGTLTSGNVPRQAEVDHV